MDKTSRTSKLHRLLHERRTVVTLQQIMAALECSRATANRVIKEMRDEFGAPIEFDWERGGYQYAKGYGGKLNLPGVWFSEQELLALLSMENMLSQMGNGFVFRLLSPVRERIQSMLQGSESNLMAQIRVIEHMQRRTRCESFEPVLAGLLQKKQIDMLYHTRGRDAREQRCISPLRLTHFRSNWYLDAWCHTRQALRRFAVDAIEQATVLTQPAHFISIEAVQAALDQDYGEFTGQADQVAVLHFEPDAARWVADELWHPQQQGDWLADGRYALRLPFFHTQALLMDILRYGDKVTVLAPESLRQAVIAQLQKSLQRYSV